MEIKEKEYILFFEAKKKFYLSANNLDARSFSSEDSEIVDKMSVRDPVFIAYLKRQVNDSMLFTIQSQCAVLIDPVAVDAEFTRLSKEREKSFAEYFKEKKVGEKLKFSASENIIPYNGFSYYKDNSIHPGNYCTFPKNNYIIHIF